MTVPTIQAGIVTSKQAVPGIDYLDLCSDDTETSSQATAAGAIPSQELDYFAPWIQRRNLPHLIYKDVVVQGIDPLSKLLVRRDFFLRHQWTGSTAECEKHARLNLASMHPCVLKPNR